MSPNSCRARHKNFSSLNRTSNCGLQRIIFPTISGMDDAIWRRIRVIEFPVQIPPEQQDKTLADRLIKELPGILQWAMEGLREWRKMAQPHPRASYNQREAIAKIITSWVNGSKPLVSANQNFAQHETCTSLYKSWCENSSLEPMHSTLFGKELTCLGFKIQSQDRQWSNGYWPQAAGRYGRRRCK